MADTSKDSSHRAKRNEGPKDAHRVKINPLYNTSAIIKGVGDVYKKAVAKPQKKAKNKK